MPPLPQAPGPTPGAAYFGTVWALALAFVVFTALSGPFIRTPYGRFASGAWGPQVPIRVGWLIMEAAALPVFLGMFWLTPGARAPLAWVTLVVWVVHYANRALFFPLAMRARPDGKFALSVAVLGTVVAGTHAWLYASWVSGLPADTPLVVPRVVAGVGLWAVGYVGILWTEHLLRDLRRTSTGYSIPMRGPFRWVSSPHYLAEILAWSGLLVATWSPAGWFVLLVTLANLVPRAAATHAWYKETFPDYPRERRALIPWVW